ncbi:hypothetical protein RR48_02428 [Papilio machaon]|uniref:Uncharacterized protein n=1 Tax=Papilio machaon TaxID=76193 RepID=A0A0N1IB15_PAPMA|nr:hypothetical protein RR48_02428 [Papilio machaon]
MSFKIKALLPLVLICCGGVRIEPGGGVGADDLAAEDSALLTHFLKTIDAATDENDLLNVTSTILNNLCVCIRESLIAKQLNIVNKNVLIPVSEAPVEEDLDHYKSIYDRTCHDLLPLQLPDVTLPRVSGHIPKCSRFDFVRKYEESFKDNQFKSKFKKIMYDILIKSKDRHKYEIKKYNLYEKPQTFDRNVMRSVIIIITLNLPKSLEAKTESSTVRLSEIDAALEDKGNIYVDFIDPAYDPKHTKISSAKNVSYCNLKSVLTVLLESEENNLTKTFKLIRKSGTIKVYTSLSTNYPYEQYSDICCYKNNTNNYCKTSMNDVNLEESKLNKGEQTDQVSKHKETITKIETLIQIYNNKLIRGQGKTEIVRTDKVQITNNKNHYYSKVVLDHKKQSTNFSNQHFTYHYKKYMSAKINNIHKNEKSNAKNNRLITTSHTTIDSLLNSQRTTDFVDVTNNEISNTVEAEKIYLKVCNYNIWSNTTIKNHYIVSNNTIPKNITFIPVPLQVPTKPKLSDNSWRVNPTETYISNYVGSTQQKTDTEVKVQRNKTEPELTEPPAYNRNNNRTTNIIKHNYTTNTPRSKILTTTKQFDNIFTKTYASGETNRSYVKSIQHTSPLNVLKEVNYESLMMNSLTTSNVIINKITKRWITPNETDITLQQSNGFSLLENPRVTKSYPYTLSTPNPNTQIQSLEINSTRSHDIQPTPYNIVTKSEGTRSSTEPTSSIKNDLRNRTLTLSKKSQLSKSLIKEIYQKKSQKTNVSHNKVIQSQESEITSSDDSLVSVTSMKNTNKRNTSHIEGTTISLMNNIKMNNHFHLQISTELPTSPISFKKAHQQSHTATEYFLHTLNPAIQKVTTPTLKSVNNYIDTSISSLIPTVLYSETITSTSSFYKNYTKSKTNATHGNIINGILNSLNNKTKIYREKYSNSNITVMKDGVTASHSVQNVTKTADSTRIPTFSPSVPVASTSRYYTNNKKSYTKSIFGQLANDSKSRKNQTKSVTFPNSEKYTNSTTTIEQTKTTSVYTLRTYYDPSNLIIHKDKVTSTHNVENITQTAVSPQIPKFLYSMPITSTSSSYKNAISSDSKSVYKVNDIKSRNNQGKTLTTTSESYPKIIITTEKKKTKSPMYSPKPRSINVKNKIHSNLARTTQKSKSDAKSEKNNLTKTTRQDNTTSRSFNTQVYYQNKINNLSNNESFTRDRFYEYRPFNVDKTKSNSSNVSAITTSTYFSNYEDKYFNVGRNKDYLLHNESVNRESKSSLSLFEQEMNNASIQNGNKINRFTIEAIVTKTKGILPKNENTKTSIEYYNKTKQVKTENTPTVFDEFALSDNLINVPFTPQLRLTTKEISIPITSPDGKSNELYVGGDSTFLTSTNKIKSNKKPTTLKLRSRNTIDISALVQTPIVSKLKLGRVIDIVDHTQRHIDLSSRQRLRQDATFAATKTDNTEEYGVDKIQVHKNEAKNGSTVNFPMYFKTTKRANRNYDNFFKITQSANSIADVFANESYDKKGIESRTSNKENTVKLSKDLFSKTIAKTTLPLPSKDYRSSITSTSVSKIEDIAAKANNKNDTKYIHTTGSNTQTKLFQYKGENTLSRVFNNAPYTDAMLQKSENLRLSELDEVGLTNQPIQNNTKLSLEPRLTGDRVLDPTFNTRPRGIVPVTLIPTNSNKELSLQNKLETTTKRTPITRYKQSSNNLRNLEQYSNQTNTTQIKKSDIARTTNILNYRQTIATKDNNGGKLVTSNKYSTALPALKKTMKSVKSAISTAKYSSDFKDISGTVKLFVQNSSISEQTLAIDTYKHEQYSNESLYLRQSKTENVVMNNSEIKTFSYAVNEINSTNISVPFIQNSIRLVSPNKIIITEYNNKANELTNKKKVLKASIFTKKNKDHYMEKKIVPIISNHSEKVLFDSLPSYSEENESVMNETNDTKVSLTNASRFIKSSFTSPNITKTTVNNVSKIQLWHSLHEATNSFIDLTTKSAHFEDLEGISNETKFTTQSYSLYTSTPSMYFNEKIREKFNSNDSLKANKTSSDQNGQFQHLELNETKFTAINISDGKLTDNVSRINKIERTYKARSEEFKTLVYFKPKVNSTAAVQAYTSKGNQQNAASESYGSTSKDFTSSPPPNMSVEQILNSIEINNYTIAAKSNDDINNTLSTNNNLSNTEKPPFSKLTQHLAEHLTTLRTNNKAVKDILDRTSYKKEEFYKATNDLNGIKALTAATSWTIPLNNNKHSTDNVRSNAINTTPTMKMPPDNINNHNDIPEHFTNRSTHNIDSVFRVSSSLLQNTRSLASYDDNKYTKYTKSLSLKLSSVAPSRRSPSEIDSETTVTKNYNESLQTISNLLINSKNNYSIENTIMFTNNSKNGINDTKILCKGPLIIASNVILLTNPESCGNPGNIKSTGNLRFPLIILTNSSNPTMKMNSDLNKTNKSIIKMDPMTVYNILLENAAKIVKEPNQYLHINDLSETPLEAINIELGHDTNASIPNEKYNDNEVELGNKTIQAIAQSINKTKKDRDSGIPQSADVTSASYSYNANSNSTRTNKVRITDNKLTLVPDTDYSTKLFTKSITEINYSSFTRQYEVLNNLKTATAAFGKTHGTIHYNAYYLDGEKNKQNENKIYSENKIREYSNDLIKQSEGSRTPEQNKIDNMEMIPDYLQLNPHINLSKSKDPYSISNLSNHKNNLVKLSNPFKMVANKNEANPYLSAALNNHPNIFYRYNKKQNQVKETKQKTNVNSNNNLVATTRTIMEHVTDTTKENKIIKYNSYQPASHISDVSLDSNMQFLQSLNSNNRKTLSNAKITLFKKFNHQTTDFKNIFKLGRKDENDDQFILKYNRRYKTITEKLKTSSTAAVERYNESQTTAQQVMKDLLNFTRKQRTFFTINTKDFFSQRRFYSKDVFKDLTKARRVPFLLQYPATPRATHVVLRPVFRNYGVVNVRQEHNFAAAPSARKDARQYENRLKDDEKSKLSLWQDKIVSFQNLLLDELKSNVLEKPEAAAPATERSVFDGLYNYNDLQAPAKIKKYYLKYLTGANNNKIAKNLEVYRRKLDPKNFKNISTTTESSSKRSRRTIFFLSPTVPYNRYF